MFKSIKTGFSMEKVQENSGIIKTINPGHDARCRATMLDVGPRCLMIINSGPRCSKAISIHDAR